MEKLLHLMSWIIPSPSPISQPSSVPRIPSPAPRPAPPSPLPPTPAPGLGREPPLPLKHGILTLAEPPGLALYHSGGIFFECNPVSQIPTSKKLLSVQWNILLLFAVKQSYFVLFIRECFHQGPARWKRSMLRKRVALSLPLSWPLSGVLWGSRQDIMGRNA